MKKFLASILLVGMASTINASKAPRMIAHGNDFKEIEEQQVEMEDKVEELRNHGVRPEYANGDTGASAANHTSDKNEKIEEFSYSPRELADNKGDRDYMAAMIKDNPKASKKFLKYGVHKDKSADGKVMNAEKNHEEAAISHENDIKNSLRKMDQKREEKIYTEDHTNIHGGEKEHYSDGETGMSAPEDNSKNSSPDLHINRASDAELNSAKPKNTSEP